MWAALIGLPGLFLFFEREQEVGDVLGVQSTGKGELEVAIIKIHFINT